MSGRTIFGAFVVFLTLASCQYLAESCEIYKFAEQKGWALVNHVIKTISRGLVQTCWSECVALPECFSINVRRVFDVIFECELNNSTKQASPGGDFVPRQGSEYHDMVNVVSKYCSLYQCVRKQVLSDGWIQLGFKALKLFTQLKNWTDARQHCQSHGGELVSITGSHEDNFVYNILAKELIDTAIRNISSGAAPPTDTYWALDGHDDDVILHGNSGYKRYMRPETALYSDTNSYAEVPKVLFNPEGFSIVFWVNIRWINESGTTTVYSYVPPDDQTFRINWNSNSNKVFFVVFAHGTAEKFLSFKGENLPPRFEWAHLALTWNKTEVKGQVVVNGIPANTILTSFNPSYTPKITSSSHYHLGSAFQDLDTKKYPFQGYLRHLMVFNRTLGIDEIRHAMNWSEYGPWIGLSDDTSDQMFAWSDGSPLGQYVPLPIYKPNTPSTVPSCVAMKNDGKWINENCSQKRPFICEKATV